MKNNQAAEDKENSCEHCGRVFLRDTTLLKHLCEQKRRWLNRDRQANRIGYGAWKWYFNTQHPNKKKTEYRDFITNHYYTAFVKFGSYCSDISVINPPAYIDWLVKNRVAIDSWTTDATYTKYLLEYLRGEDCMDAVKRTMECLLDVATAENILLQDVFKYANKNKLCYLVTTGRISPWVLYHSKSGIQFLEGLDSGQANLLFDYIDPQKWSIKFMREAGNVAEVKRLVNEIGL